MAFRGEPVGALICLLLCGAFDSFDGMAARTKKGRTEEEKKFGIQIDSLVDMFSFGIFPAIIGYTMGLNGWLWFAIFALYAICAVSRLGYFNVAEEMRKKETTEKKTEKNIKMKIARMEKNLSQIQLAERVGVTRQTIGMIEAGDFNPSLKLCIAICKELDCTLNDLFWEE